MHLNFSNIQTKLTKYWCYEGALIKHCWDNGLCFLFRSMNCPYLWALLFIWPFCSYCDTYIYLLLFNLCNFFLHIIIMYTIVKMWCFWKLFLLWHSVLIVNEFNFFSIIINLQCTCVYQNRPILFILLTVSQNSSLSSRQKHFQINSPWIITALRVKFMICVSLFKNWIIADKRL